MRTHGPRRLRWVTTHLSSSFNLQERGSFFSPSVSSHHVCSLSVSRQKSTRKTSWRSGRTGRSFTRSTWTLKRSIEKFTVSYEPSNSRYVRASQARLLAAGAIEWWHEDLSKVFLVFQVTRPQKPKHTLNCSCTNQRPPKPNKWPCGARSVILCVAIYGQPISEFINATVVRIWGRATSGNGNCLFCFSTTFNFRLLSMWSKHGQSQSFGNKTQCACSSFSRKHHFGRHQLS